jgi:hypothetical protein
MVAFGSFLWLHELCTRKCAALRTVETIKIALTAQCDACGRDCAHAKQLRDLIGIITCLKRAASNIEFAFCLVTEERKAIRRGAGEIERVAASREEWMENGTDIVLEKL